MNLLMRRSAVLRWLIGAVMVTSLAVPVMAAAAPSQLLLSTSPDRSGPIQLQGSTATGNIFVFVPDDPAITRVRFWLDNPQMSGTPTKTENGAPWDFAGTNTGSGLANAYDTTKIFNGSHSISAKVTLSSGAIESLSSTFTVDNSGGGSDGLSFSPDSLNFSVQQEGTTAPKTTSLGTISGPPASFTLTEASPWLQVSPSTGTTPSVVTASIDATGLAPGTYSATVTASAPGLSNALLAVSLQVTEAPGTRALLVSKQAIRSSPVALAGTTQSDNIYVFVPDDPAITRVRFWLDNPQMSGTPTKTENGAPWDFAGTNTGSGLANAYDTTKISNGSHSISVKVTLSSGAIVSLSSTFTVDNSGGGSDGLSFSPDSLNFSVQQGGTTAPKTTSLGTISGPPASFTLTEASPWLQVSPSTGTTPSVVTASIDATGLAPGTYSATVTASAPGLPNALLAVTLQGSEAPGTRMLMVSKQANRSAPVTLAGTTQGDNIFVFVPADPAITRVRFWLDNPQMSGTPTKTENNAPWDFAGSLTNGNANPYDTTKISNGSHTITAAADLSGGGSETLNAEFTVSNTFDRPPDQIHLAWVQDPSTTLTFVWHTTHTATPSDVRYRKKGLTSWTVATGSLRPSGTLGTLHEATVTGLSPSTEYEYQLRGDGIAWSPTLATRTAPSPGPASFDVVYFADTGLIGRNDGLATGTEQVIEEIAALDPLFVLPGGDYAYFDTDKRYGSLNNTIDAWFNQMNPVSTRAPMMPTYGNHEALLGEGFEHWAARFPTPEGLEDRMNYSFDVGDAHFVSIFAVQGFQGLSSAQLTWIEQDILAAKERGQRWIIPYYHVSPFTDGTVHPSNLQLRAQLGPLFEQLGVQIAVSSHDQSYERSYPLSNVPSTNTRTSTSLSCYTLDDGVTWVKVSPAGKLSNKTGSFSAFASSTPPAWTAYRDNTMHHIARIHVDATGYLRFDAYGVVGDGTAPVLLDSFEYRDGEC
jgi:hypothetical protein